MPFRLTAWTPVHLDDLVRLGRDYDGGYVVSAACLAATDVLVGMGINDDWSFEADFAARRPGLSIVAIDGSVSPVLFRRNLEAAMRRVLPAAAQADWRALRRALADARHWWATARGFDRFFSAPGRAFLERFVGPADLTWRELSRTLLRDGARLFVKMDIEGGEYDILPELATDHHRISGLTIEFHDCGTRWAEFSASMQRLSEHFAVAHLHGNNWAPLVPGSTLPSVIEASFVHRRLVPQPTRPRDVSRLPLAGLDMPNAAERDEYILPF